MTDIRPWWEDPPPYICQRCGMPFGELDGSGLEHFLGKWLCPDIKHCVCRRCFRVQQLEGVLAHDHNVTVEPSVPGEAIYTTDSGAVSITEDGVNLNP